MKKIETKNWACPTGCGCIVEITTSWGVDIEEIDSMVDSIMQKKGIVQGKFMDAEHFDSYRNHLREETIAGMQERKVKVEPTRIITQCLEHSTHTTPQELHTEINNFHGNAYTPLTCNCTLHTVFDVRDVENTQAPDEHLLHTRRCEFHEDLDTEEHHEVVMAEALKVSMAINQIAADLAIPPEEVSSKIVWNLDENRELVIDNVKMGVAKGVIEASLAKLDD